MFSKTVEFEDFNGVKTSKVFYFHLSKAELMSMMGDGDAMMQRIQRIIAAKDIKAILEEFRALIQLAAGIRSEDGQRFIKTPEAQSELFDSPAYDELLMELCTKADASADFVRQLIPEKLQKEMQAQMEKGSGPSKGVPNPFGEPTEHEDQRPAWMKENRSPTQQELMTMSREEMQLAFQHRNK